MEKITVEVVVERGIEKVWEFWNEPEHITQWAFASDTWECPRAENDARVGGKFVTRMAARDGSAAFDFSGTYTEVVLYEKIAYRMDDGRTASLSFEKVGENVTKIIETFDPESENPIEMQRGGWQAILSNFKTYAESI